MDLLFPDAECLREKIVKGEIVTNTIKPSWVCYCVVIMAVIDALNQLPKIQQNPLKASLLVTLDGVSAYIMYHHCGVCQAWRGFFVTLGLEVVGKSVITAMLK